MPVPNYVVDEKGNAIPLAGDEQGRLVLAQARIGGARTTWVLIILNAIQTAALIYIAIRIVA